MEHFALGGVVRVRGCYVRVRVRVRGSYVRVSAVTLGLGVVMLGLGVVTLV